MPTDYNRMKVGELRDALTARGLPTNGLKGELISRLTASDESASPAIASTEKRSTPAITTATATITPTTAPAAHLPSAEEDYEVDWEHDDKPVKAAPAIATASAPAATPTVAPAAVAPAETSAAASPARTDAKPKRKTIASLFENTSALLTKSGNEPSSPSTVTDETSSAAPVPTSAVAAATPAFSANLPTTSLDEEIARRKKRAERFGLSAEESETLKSLERQKRFGIVREKQIKGLDEALPVERERKRRGELQSQQPQGRAGKRGRFENAASLQQQQQQQQQQRDGTRRGGRGKGNGAVESGRVQKPVQTSGLSAEDKKRAEERRKRFAA